MRYEILNRGTDVLLILHYPDRDECIWFESRKEAQKEADFQVRKYEDACSVRQSSSSAR